MKKWLLVLSSVLFFSSAYAEKNYTFNNNLKKAYEKIMQLKLEEANQIIKSERRSNPSNLMNEFIADYIDYYSLLVNGSSSQFKKLERNKDIRLKKMQGGDFMSPYYLYTKAEIKIHWAILRTQYGDKLTAFRELRSAYKLLESNQKKFPKFIANKKSLGMLRTIFSAIPPEYQWSTRAMGVSGDFNRGHKEIQEVLNYSKKYKFIFEKEARIIYSFLLLSVKNDEVKAWKMINHASIDPKTSLLACFIQMRVAMKIRKNTIAIRLIENRPKSNGYLDIPQMNYWLGVAKMRTLDKKANTYLKQYINSNSSPDYIKSSYLYLAYYEQSLRHLVTEHGRAYLFAVYQGKLAEGANFRGNLIRSVICVSIPLEYPQLFHKRLSALYRQRFAEISKRLGDHVGHKATEYALERFSLSLILQACGRGIRSETDRCAFILLDKRYHDYDWRRFLRPSPFNLPQPIKGVLGFQQEVSPPDGAGWDQALLKYCQIS